MAGILERHDARRASAYLRDMGDPTAQPPKKRNNLSRGVLAGLDQMQGLGYGLIGALGDVTGADSLAEYGIAGYQRNMDEAAENAGDVMRIEDIDGIDSAVEWAAYTLGAALPSLATVVGTGGLGALAGAAGAKVLLKKQIAARTSALMANGMARSEAAKLAATTTARKAAKAAAVAGATSASGGIGTGSTFGRIEEETGEIRGDVALVSGALQAIPDTVPIFMVANRIGIPADAVRRGIAGRLQRGAIEGLKVAGAEGVTEAIQTVIEQAAVDWVDGNLNLFDEDSMSEIWNALAGGTLVGFGMGGAAGLSQSGAARADEGRVDVSAGNTEQEVDAAVEQAEAKAKADAEAIRRAGRERIAAGDQAAGVKARSELERLNQAMESLRAEAQRRKESLAAAQAEAAPSTAAATQPDLEVDEAPFIDLGEPDPALEGELMPRATVPFRQGIGQEGLVIDGQVADVVAPDGEVWVSRRAAVRALRRSPLRERFEVVPRGTGFALSVAQRNEAAKAASSNKSSDSLTDQEGRVDELPDPLTDSPASEVPSVGALEADEPLLQGYDETDVAQREAAEQQARSEARAAEQRAEQQDTADNFALTGSDREADEAAARGQEALFIRPPTGGQSATGRRPELGPERGRIEENGTVFETGTPVSFPFQHITDSATKQFGLPDANKASDVQFGRTVEPSGRYMTAQIPPPPNPKMPGTTYRPIRFDNAIYGEVTFSNPLVLRDTQDYSWKQKLSAEYNGLTGKELSKAIMADGHDGIVVGTSDGRHTTEIVDLTTFDEAKAQYRRSGAAPSGGVKVARARIIAQRVAKRWPNAPTIDVVESLAQVPGLDPRYADDTEIRGVYLNATKTVHLVAPAHDTEVEVESTLLHEVQHAATRTAFGKDVIRRLDRLGALIRDEHGTMDRYVQARGINYDYRWYDQQFKQAGLSRAQADAKHVDELLAIMAGDKVTLGGRLQAAAKAALAAIRDWLRRHGFTLSASLPDDALVKTLLETQKVMQEGPDPAVRPIRSRATNAHRVWHGTPHQFDKFSTANIGTGEGAQAYGWGLYFADSRKVSQYYKDALTNADNDNATITFRGGSVRSKDLLEHGGEHAAQFAELIRKGMTYQSAKDRMIEKAAKEEADIDSWLEVDPSHSQGQWEKKGYVAFRNWLETTKPEDFVVTKSTNPGALYQVDLKPNPNEYLLYDETLDKQPEVVRKALLEGPVDVGLEDGDTMVGGYAYGKFEVAMAMDPSLVPIMQETAGTTTTRPDQLTSEYLKALGVRGVKYKDQGSRLRDGDASYNYVIFDDEDAVIEAAFSRRPVSLEKSLRIARNGSFRNNRELKVELQKLAEPYMKEVGIYENHIGKSGKKGEGYAKARADRIKYMTRNVVADAKYALRDNANAIGWYDKTVREALEVLALSHPEINTDPNARFAFRYILAVTSNGLKVDKNFQLADAAYRKYKESGRMPTNIGIGTAKGAINDALKMFNTMTDKMGLEAFSAFMDTDATVGDLTARGHKLSGEHVDTLVKGSAILGPKIGGGFYQNLGGNFDPITIDRWLMRTWGRWNGTLISERQDMIDKKAAELQAAIDDLGVNARPVYDDLLDGKLAGGDINAIAKMITKKSMLPSWRKEANEVDGGAIRKIGNSLTKYLDGQKEAPANAVERAEIRETFAKGLKALQKEMPELTMADLQALLWYPEKKLYDVAKSKASNAASSYNEDEAPDYANAAALVARNSGIPQETIDAARQAARADAAAGRPLGRQLDRRADGRSAGVQRGVRSDDGRSGSGNEDIGSADLPAFSRPQRQEVPDRVSVIHGIRRKYRAAFGRRGGNAFDRPFARAGRGNAGRDGLVGKVLRAQSDVSAELAAVGENTPKFIQLDPSDAAARGFHEAISEAKAANRFGASVYVYDEQDYRDMKLYLTESGGAGFAIKPDGDLVSVFSTPGSVDGRSGVAITMLAVQEGARKLDAFDTILPGLYSSMGFVESGRDSWSDQYMPAGWDKSLFSSFNNGEPDVVYMTYDPANFEIYNQDTRNDGRSRQEGARQQVDQGTDANSGRGARDTDVAGNAEDPYEGNAGRHLQGLPDAVEVDGRSVRFTGFKPAEDAARAYAASAGLPYQAIDTYEPVNVDRAERIAQAFEQMPHAPNDPEVKRAYRAMIDETYAQYQAMLDAGVTVEFNDGGDPYGNPRNAILDVVNNNHMYVFATKDGFGSDATFDANDNPLLEVSPFQFAGQEALANDVFRAVHDYFGHIRNGVGFRARGEENAWRSHATMFSPLARKAATTETRGQNSWVNYGPKAEFNRTASGADTVYADQKIGLLPDWAMEDNVLDLSDDVSFSRPPSDPAGEAESGITETVSRLRRRTLPPLKRWAKRNFTKEGLLNKSTFLRKIFSDSMKNVGEADVAALVHDMEETLTKAYGVSRYGQVPKQKLDAFNAYMGGDRTVELPAEVKATADALRAHVDRLSGEMINVLKDMISIDRQSMTAKQVEAMRLYYETNGEQGSVPPRIMKNLNTWATVQGNLGTYLTRSYQAFDDVQWKDKVLENADLMARAEAFISEQNPDLSPGELRGAVRAILQSAKDSGNFLSFIGNGSKYGSKDVSIFKRRKNVPPVIRELLGEYTDPRINFARSASKMQFLVANHAFLSSVRKDGLGLFLHTSPVDEYDTQVASKGSDTMDPLNGLYTTEDFVQGLKDAVDGFEGSGLMREIIRYNSMVKYGKTILSPTTQLRNFQSALMFTVMNGHFDWSSMGKAFRATKADLFTKDDQWRAYLNDLIGLGVLHDNPYAGELRDAIKDFTDQERFAPGVQGTLKRGLDFMQRAYSAGDDFWKIIGFENEVSLATQAGMPLEAARQQAATRIRNGYPTYSMVPRSIKLVRQWPLIGTFVSFPYEAIRTTYNQIGFIRDDMASGNKKAATRRVLGMALASASAAAVSKLSMIAMGMSDEDDEAVRDLMPPWSKNSQLAYLGYDDDGLPIYLDLSYLDPYTYWKRPITAILNGNNETVARKMLDAANEMADPFIGVDIAAGAALEIVFNKKLAGGQVYNEADTAWRQTLSIADHARKALQPGVMSNIERTYKAIQGDVSNSGKEYTLANEGMGWLGHRVSTLNIRQSMIYKAYEFNDEIRQATSIVSRIAGSPRRMSEAKIEAAYESMRTARRRAFTRMNRLAEGAQALGVPKRQVIAALKVARISEKNRDAILGGEIPPFEVSTRFTKAAEERAAVSASTPERARELRLEMARRREIVRRLIQEDQR